MIFKPVFKNDGKAYDYLKWAVNMKPRKNEDWEQFELKKVESYYSFGMYWLDKGVRNKSMSEQIKIDFGEAYKNLKIAAE